MQFAKQRKFVISLPVMWSFAWERLLTDQDVVGLGGVFVDLHPIFTLNLQVGFAFALSPRHNILEYPLC